MTNDLIDQVPPAFSRLGKDEHIIWSPSLAGVVDTGPKESLEARTAIAALSGLVNSAYRASRVSSLALSWRDFRVGACAVMCNFESGFIGYLDGYNVKPAQGKSNLNLHAEQVAIAKGRINGLNRVIGIAVFADPNDDDANPNGHQTLRPCGRCVEMFSNASEVDDRTLVLGTNADLTECELYTVGSLNAKSPNDSPHNNRLVDYGFPLVTEEDLEHYDRQIQPSLIIPIMDLYNTDHL